MATTFKELYLLLMARIPSLPLGEAKNCVVNAYRDILNFVPWSFLIGQGFLNIPTAVGVNATIVSGRIITIDQPTNAALLASQSIERTVTGRQFRYSDGFLYTIEDYDPGTLSVGVPTGVGVLTLDRAFWDDATAPFSASVYQAYYIAPQQPDGTIDFVSFYSVVSRQRSWPIGIAPSRAQIDNMDPRRVYFGPTQVLVPFDTVTVNGQSGIERYEAYPHPQAEDQLLCYFRMSGVDFSVNGDGSQSPPVQIDVATIRSRALYYAYDWAEGNKGRAKELVGPNWMLLAQKANKDYMDDLRRANVKDRDSHLRASVRSLCGPANITTVSWNGQSVTFPTLGGNW